MSGNRFCKLGFLFLFPLCLFAASPNDAKDISINSQSFEYNHNTGVAVYTGNVYAQQGTRKLWGDKLEVLRGKKGDVDLIIVTGLPARLEQDGDVYEAPLIEYDLIKNTVRSPQNQKGQTTITLKPRSKS